MDRQAVIMRPLETTMRSLNRFLLGISLSLPMFALVFFLSNRSAYAADCTPNSTFCCWEPYPGWMYIGTSHGQCLDEPCANWDPFDQARCQQNTPYAYWLECHWLCSY